MSSGLYIKSVYDDSDTSGLKDRGHERRSENDEDGEREEEEEEEEDDDDDDDDDDTSLPFPKPLSRAGFLTADFDPADFLGNLTSRFQTLDDLQAELRQLSATIHTELVDLVNDHYEEFLGLGASLSGGEEQVEELRVGLMGVERELGVLKERVVGERERVAEVMQLKADVVREANVGRRLLDIDRRLADLELAMGIVGAGVTEKQGGNGGKRETSTTGAAKKWGDEWTADDVQVGELDLEDDEDDDGDEADGDEADGDEADEADDNRDGNAAAKEEERRPLVRRVDQWLCLKHLISTCDGHHAFLVAEQPRLKRVKDTILRDIDAAIRLRSDAKGKQNLLKLRSQIED